MGIAYLSCKSLHHILTDHPDITMFDLLCLPEMIKRGLWIADRKKSACVIYKHSEGGLRYKSALKVVGDGYETYISTFHRVVDERQLKSIMKRGRVLAGRGSG